MAAQSWKDLLSQLDGFHMGELVSQKEQYEAQLSEMHDEVTMLSNQLKQLSGMPDEVTMLGNQLKQAKRVIAGLDPSISLDGLEAAEEQYRVGVAADGGAGDVAVPGVPPDAGHGEARSAWPPAPLPAPLAAEGGPAEEMPTAPLAAEGGPAEETPTAHVPAAADRALTAPPPEAHTKNEPRSGARYLWKVVGGDDAGGVELQHPKATRWPIPALRLTTGTLVEEIKFCDDLLHFRRLAGVGPKEGWVFTKLQGKTVVARLDRTPLKPRQLPPLTVGPNSEPPLPIALVFPENYPMKTTLEALRRIELPGVKEKLDKAKEITGFDVQVHPQNVWQGCLCSFMAAAAGLENLKAMYPEVMRRTAAVTGFGLGFYMALVDAGVLSFRDALKLVKLRSVLFQEAKKLRRQGMIEVTGLGLEILWSFCLEARSREGLAAVCEVTVYVKAKTFFISGTETALGLVESMATKIGGQVRRAAEIAPHCELFKPVQARFEAVLDEALPNMKPPLRTVWMPSSAEPVRPGCDPAEIVAELRREISNPVLFQQSCEEMVREGIRYVHEVSVTAKHNLFKKWTG